MSEREAGVEVRRSGDRFVTVAYGIESRHSFSFGGHYDPGNVGHALLVAHNDDIVVPGAGYPTHPHHDLEIVTWVVEGGLRHEDSAGNAGVVVPGLAQRLSAGRGVRHSEVNEPGAGGPVRFVQMWVSPDEPGLEPSYAQRDVTADLATGRLVPVASGSSRHRGDTAVRIHNAAATLHVARLVPGQQVTVPEAPYVHLFLTRGSGELEAAGRLEESDTARLTRAGARRFTAGGSGAELLAWEMHRTR
jgi:redox-sensitive bicupin YhaK (pirin superfamily)